MKVRRSSANELKIKELQALQTVQTAECQKIHKISNDHVPPKRNVHPIAPDACQQVIVSALYFVKILFVKFVPNNLSGSAAE